MSEQATTTEVPDMIYPRETAAESAELAKKDPTDQPVPLWPEGVIAIVAIATLAYVGIRHRVFIKRKVDECKRAVDEFQKHGGTEELQQLARLAGDFFKR